MRKIILLILTFLVVFSGLLLGPVFVEYDGYVLIVTEDGTMQLRIFGVLLILVALFFTGWLIFKVVKVALQAFSGSKNLFGGWSSRKRQRAFSEGLLSLAAGDHHTAQKQLALIEDEDFDGVNLIAAAEVELNLGNETKALELWEKAYQYPKAEIAAKIHTIKHLLAQNKVEDAQSVVDSFEEKHFKQKPVIDAAVATLAKGGKWEALEQKLPKWKKVLGESHTYWQQQASQGTFAEIASKKGALQLKESWSRKTRAEKKDAAKQAAYAKQLLTQQMYSDAEEVLLTFQKSGPQPELLPLFRELKLKTAANSIKRLETWIKSDNLNPELYSILGELAFNSDDLVLAEKALGKSVSLNKNARDLRLMATIKERQNDDKLALQFYKQSLSTPE